MKQKHGKFTEHIAFLGPATLVFTVIVVVPFLISIYYSLTDWNGISKTMNFIGFNNYIDIFSGNSRFLEAFGFTVSISFVIVVLTNVIGIALAALLTNRFYGSNLFRAVFFLPNTMGGVVMGYIWRFIFLLVIQYLGTVINWSIFQLPWIGTEETAFIALVIVSVWQGVGYVMVIMIAALSGVPHDLSEAARIDGASSWKIFWKIKIPFCMPYLTVCLFWTIASAFKMFDVNVALTKGGPYGSTTPMALQIYYDAFNANRYGFANAESIVFFLIIFFVTSIQLFFKPEKGACFQMNKKRTIKIIRFISTLVLALLFFAPFVLVIYNSVKPQSQIMTDLLGLPQKVMWENYSNAWQELKMSTVLTNTVVVSLFSVAVIILFAAMVSYWMVRHSTRFSRILEKLLLGSLLIPFASVMLPLVKTMATLGLNTSLWGGIFTYVGIGLAFATFIMTGAVRAIPIEIEEAAMIDGCNTYQVFFKIVLPIVRPTFLSIFILDLFWIWNDYIVALTMLNSSGLNTVQLAINKLFGLHANQWDVALPAIVMSIAPILIINVLLQKKIIAGIAAGATKG